MSSRYFQTEYHINFVNREDRIADQTTARAVLSGAAARDSHAATEFLAFA
jgi:hypothetical protein